MTVPKYKRKALEKIWNILQEVEEKRQITAEFHPIILPAVSIGVKVTSREAEKVFEDRRAVFVNLESLGAIMDVEHPNNMIDNWVLFVGDKYKSVFEKYESAYSIAADDYKSGQEMKETDAKGPIYVVKYSGKSREILVNNILLAKPDFNSENELVFTYIYEHPNERISLVKFQETQKITLTKSIHKIIENLGFVGDFKRVFFSDVSKDYVRFRNPITSNDLKELGIKNIRLK